MSDLRFRVFYCQKCGEKIRMKIDMKCDSEQTLCGLCMDDELNAKNRLPWTELLPMLSINPDAATTHDVFRMAGELMEARSILVRIQTVTTEMNAAIKKFFDTTT